MSSSWFMWFSLQVELEFGNVGFSVFLYLLILNVMCSSRARQVRLNDCHLLKGKGWEVLR